MNKINLILVDSDLDYLHRFSRYIRDSKYGRIFALKLFTDLDLLHQYLKQVSEPSILCLVDDGTEIAPLKDKYLTKVILSNREVTGTEDCLNRVIYKLQPLNLVIAEIYSYYLENNQSRLIYPNKSDTKIITITAASGDYDKNKFSLLLAKYLTSTQHKVFYLNLETVSALDYFLHKPQNYDLSKIIYHLKKQPGNVVAYIEKYKKEEYDLAFDYFERVQHINDLLELNQIDLVNLFKGFMNLGIYDYLIVDLDSAIAEPNLTAMIEADYRLILVGNDQYSLTKSMLIEDYLSSVLLEETIKLDYILVKDNAPEQQLLEDICELSFVGYLVSENRTEAINMVNIDKYFTGLELYLNKLNKFNRPLLDGVEEEF